PVIQDQTINTTVGKQIGDLVGQIIASDPDSGQTLSYAMIEDNSGGYLTLNTSNGKLSANKPFPTSGSHSAIVRISVTDNASSPLSASANVTINVNESSAPDSTAPIISAFSIPSSSNSLTVDVISFSASDNQGVIGYKL